MNKKLICAVLAIGIIVTACKKDTYIKATEIILNTNTAVLAIGDTLMLEAIVAPENATDKTVVWTSNNTNVASVVDGRIIGIGGGTATITASTRVSNGKNKGYSLIFADCDIMVIPDATSVTLNKVTVVLYVGDTLDLFAKIQPYDADKTATWTSSNTTVASVANNRVTEVGVRSKVTALSEGSTDIVVTTSSNKTATCVVTVIQSFPGTVSFKTDSIWVVSNGTITQTWSDVVMAIGCKKTDYYGRTENDNFKADCRQNSAGYGDFFSWEAVNQYKAVLCPDGWRVPTTEDFIDLDKALGGNGNNRNADTTILAKYMGDDWGGAYGGIYPDMFGNGHTTAYYWSQTQVHAESGYYLGLSTSGNIGIKGSATKSFGLMLRCVR